MTTKVVYPKYLCIITLTIYSGSYNQKVILKEKIDSFLTFQTNFLVRTLQYTENLFYFSVPHDYKGKSPQN